jgi:FtsH-binding integral membrane protein
MTRDMSDFDRTRREIMRRATLYTYGFLGVALLLALGVSALVAWFLTLRGHAFLRTWFIITMIVLVPSALGLVVQEVKARSSRPSAGRDAAPPSDTGTWPKNRD